MLFLIFRWEYMVAQDLRNPVQKDLYKLDYFDSHLWFLMLLKMYSEAFQLVETECLILTSKRIKHASSNASQKDIKLSNTSH